MRSSRDRRRTLLLSTAAGAAILLAAACGGGGTGNKAPTGGTPMNGGTASWALPPNSVPNYIFPFMPIQDFSVYNSNLQYQLWRPLVWAGKGGQAALDWNVSLINQPKFSGKKITVNLKPYKFSDGTPVDAKAVMFWVNMAKVEKKNFAPYVPGQFPDNVKSVHVDSGTQLTFTTDKAYSPQWFTWNQLSQITPMPESWDKDASGKKSCSTKVSDCKSVYDYLAKQAKDLKSYATAPLWQTVDGPWKMSAFNSDGHVTLVPNKAYSGPVKPRLAQFKMVPFTTEDSEYNVLRSGKSDLSVGYLPTVDAPNKPANAKVGRNPVPGYSMDPWISYSINYFPVNQNNPKTGPMLRQTYVRQAIEYLMNQESVIKGPLRGYGSATVGPVPNTPPDVLSPQLKTNPFPYDPAKAKQLLTSHGWTVTPNGVTTCANPSQCGPGIKKGAKLEFKLLWATGNSWIESEMKQLQSNTSTAGIKLDLKGGSFNQVEGTAVPCKASQKICDWDMGDWGGGWVFAPDYYPSGETLFQTGAGSNSGSYTDKTNDQMIAKTLTSSNPQDMYTWQNYLSKQVPVIWQPNGDYALTEVKDNLRGVIPQNVFLNINPENWYFVK
ncbi:MAG TPA: ABC transporter substrate-binding protein [Streptosporangiaceae bacterium]|jgi:peptide/nickel transport system substrate-binding protein